MSTGLEINIPGVPAATVPWSQMLRVEMRGDKLEVKVALGTDKGPNAPQQLGKLLFCPSTLPGIDPLAPLALFRAMTAPLESSQSPALSTPRVPSLSGESAAPPVAPSPTPLAPKPPLRPAASPVPAASPTVLASPMLKTPAPRASSEVPEPQRAASPAFLSPDDSSMVATKDMGTSPCVLWSL